MGYPSDRRFALSFFLPLLAWAIPGAALAQEIPLEHCDTLPLIEVKVAEHPRWFLVDTAATANEVHEAQLASEMQRDTARCTKAFNESDEKTFCDCLDPQVVMFTTKEELYGREKVSSYFRERYFHQSSPARLVIHESAFHAMGDAVWYEYEFTIDSARGRLRGRGVAMCKKAAGRWRMASMHHSEVQFEPSAASGAGR